MAIKLALGLCWLVASANAVQASTPLLSQVLPRGVTRGAEHTLRLSGQRIGDVREVLFYDAGITVLEFSTIDANNIDVKISVDAECRLGEHVVQVRTGRGFSDYRSLYVGAFPAVAEVEPNTTFDQAQPISRGITVTGVITPEDVDYFAVDLKQGDRLSVEIEAIRLGAMFDSFIAVLDADRFELAVSDDTPLYDQDGFFTLLAPADGRYTIMIREASYGGNDNCHYRVHIGEFLRPTAVYPAGGQPGSEVTLSYLGDPAGPVQQTVTLPESLGIRSALFVADERGLTPSAMPFRLNSLPNVLETEPNNEWPTEPIASPPVALNGIIGVDDESDFYMIEAKKDQVWEVECYAKRIGSGLDAVINIYKEDKSQVGGNDDARGLDPYLRFQVPEDGRYFIRVRDQLRRGQEDFVYRLEIAPIEAALSISIPRVDRYSQRQQTIMVPKGNRYAVLINAARENFGGPIELLGDALPAGITMQAPPMSPNLPTMPVVFEAAADAEVAGGLFDFRARRSGEGPAIEGGFRNLADFALGEPNNARYYGCVVDKLAMAVTEPAPFRIELTPPQAPLVRDGSLDLHITLHRDEGFQGPVNLQFPFRPPGVGTNYQITIPAEQSEIKYTLNAAGNAQVGVWPVFVIGSAGVDGGPLWVSTKLTDLEVADPYVRIDAKRAACEQGQPAQVFGTIEQVRPFEGEALVNLMGLPPNVTCAPVSIKADATEVVFQLQTSGESPLGNHKSLFCQVVQTVGGQQVTSVTGRTEFQINPPTAPPPAASEQPAQPPPQQTTAPLSRLEQLRKAARERNQKEPGEGQGGTP